ncbi:alpha-amylase family glycosyl hydrolase [Bacillus sp. DJP31]|uniref:alpha-amylase family glycosyl hydrolase n=1 Tax=Bacillus sp. DJP31 TaxID=3409789 RepID=UPI003BB7DDBF
MLIPFLLFCGFQVKAVEKEEGTWQDELIYFIMVDRFNNGDTSNDFEVDINDPRAYHGGDLKGVTDKLDYIKEMGFTAIWLTPIVKNEEKGYHGYWTEDFYEVEEHFGTLEDVKTLVKEAHNRDIKVILDLVVNHTGYQHPWLNDPKKADWFHEKKDITNWDNQDNVENGQLFGLPDLAHENQEVEKYLLDMAKWWITETDIDGYRLDTVRHVPKSFWEKFSSEVKSVKEDFFLIGEVWHEDPRYVAAYGETGIDSFVDYPLYEGLNTTFRQPDQPVDWLHKIWLRNEAFYENPYLLGTFLDNHDNLRFTREVVQKKQNPETRLKLALTYLYGAPGIPIIYYGTEIALDGGEDPDNRRMMAFRADKVIIDYISKLASIRKEFPSLRYGDFKMLFEDKGMAVFKRTYEDETTILAINNASETITAEFDVSEVGENRELRALLSDDIVRPNQEQFMITMDRETANIFQIGEETGVNWPVILGMIGVWAIFGLFLVFAIRRQKRKVKEE